MKVAPFTGAWIEMPRRANWPEMLPPSHPSRVRGLKFLHQQCHLCLVWVAPFTGAWIEIVEDMNNLMQEAQVAPFTGAWIEISTTAASLCGKIRVAPFTGAWIEIHFIIILSCIQLCRTLHGCVD